MSTLAHEQPSHCAPREEPAEVREPGSISDTEGGILGAQCATAVGWQYY